MIYSAAYNAPEEIGALTLASDGEALVGLWLSGQKYYGGTVDEPMRPDADLAAFEPVREWLDEYFAGGDPDAGKLLLRPNGTPFRKRVWDKLLGIPLGSLRTYGDIAAQIGAESGRRCAPIAVGGAVGHNPISIIVPCHRVVGASGSLTGYAGGVERKRWLLEHEGAFRDGLFIPKRGTAL